MNGYNLLPGDTIGIIDNNNINTPNLVMEIKKMGLKVGVYNDKNNYATKIADFSIVNDLLDKDYLKKFAGKCKIITYMDGKINTKIIHFLSKYTMIPQGTDILDIMQDRLIQRAFFDQINVNMIPYETIVQLGDIYQSIDSIGYPAVLKPIQKSILNDKKLIINNPADITKAAKLLNYGSYVLESYINDWRKYSVIVVKGFNGNRSIFTPVRIKYDQQVTTAFTPDKLNQSTKKEMKNISNDIANSLNYNGAFEITFLLNNNENLYVQNVSPGFNLISCLFNHASVNEYEKHIKALIGVPLSITKLPMPLALKSFTKDQLSTVQKQWSINANFNFVFLDDNKSNILGYVINYNNSIDNALKQFHYSNIWND